MIKFLSILSRYEAAEFSQLEAAELLGVDERTFRRWRQRFEDEGEAGLLDRRLGKASPREVPVDEAMRVEDLYRTRYSGFTAKHFHEHLVRDHGFRWGYTWTKTFLHSKGLQERAKRRGAHRRGRSERVFLTLQDRLTKELALAGIVTIEAANVFIRDVYIPAHNARFAVKPEQEGAAFVAIPGVDLAEILCIQEDRRVGNDNCVSFNRRKLQIPASPLRAHFVKANVKVRLYPDGTHAIFHGPRCLGRYDENGAPAPQKQAA